MSASDSAIPQYVPAPTQPGSAHLIGICGSGMSALANVLRGLGWNVTGSDTSLAPPGNAVPSGPKQAVVAARHAGGATPNDCDLVIHSAAVPDEDPERIAARRRGIPSLSLAEALGWVTHGRPLAAVAGTHGKSSATSMMASILRFAGRKPLVVCGARQLGYTSGGDAGRDGLAIVEACEYREHFLHLRPRYAALLGIEPDHFDCFDSDAALDAAYAGFVAQIPSDGLLLVNAACRRAQRVVARARCRRERFAVCWPPRGDGRLAGDVEWTAVVSGHERGRYAFELNYGGETLGYVRLATVGAHMVSNALAAAALAWHQGVSGPEITAGLSVFPGLHRRVELLGEYAGVAVADDYAHHPTEVAASLRTLREVFPQRRLWCVFQPHQASRLSRLLGGFATSLREADRLLVAHVFRAREGPPQSGEATAALLAQRVAALGAATSHETQVACVHDEQSLLRVLQSELTPGDVLVTMGAGDIGALAERVIAWLAAGDSVRHLPLSAA